MISEYPEGELETPGGIKHKVNVIKRFQPIKQDKRNLEVPFLDESGVTFLAKMAQESVDHGRDCFIIVTGDRGTGKSTLIQKGARRIDPEFDPEKSVAFRLEDFEKKFDDNPQGDGANGVYPQVIMDEAGYAMYGPQWLVREQQVVAKQLIISRIKRQIIWMAVPKRKQLNNQVRDMARIWVHVGERVEYDQGYAVVRTAPVQLQSEFYSEKYWEPKYAFHFTKESGPAWDAYEARKVEFVSEVTKETAEGRNLKGGRNIEIRDKVLQEYVRYRKRVNDPISQSDLAKVAGMGVASVNRALNRPEKSA